MLDRIAGLQSLSELAATWHCAGSSGGAAAFELLPGRAFPGERRLWVFCRGSCGSGQNAEVLGFAQDDGVKRRPDGVRAFQDLPAT